MKWPPYKAWTSTRLRNGYRHFVAINYGEDKIKRWALMVSVLDTNTCLTISYKELCDLNEWNIGWLDIPRDEANPPPPSSKSLPDKEFLDQSSLILSVSLDSGLAIPISRNQLRPWFREDD